jgi:hypothetical protein
MTNSIKNIVSESLDQARMEACNYDRTMTLADVRAEVDSIVDFIKFDTNVARLMFMGFIDTELQKTAPSLFPPKMGMDREGNYTSNQQNWV